MAKYTVKQGECIESIAYRHGFFWQTLWDEPQNTELKRKHKNPNALLPGDDVFVPEKQEKQVPGATEQRHQFRRRGVPSKIHIVVKKGGKPRANAPYVLDIDGELFSGKTNAKGEVKHAIPPNAKSGKLKVGDEPDADEYELLLGYVDPLEGISGVQARLNNMGFNCGEPDGKMNARTVGAVKAFQEEVGLQVSGEIDPATEDAIKQEHGS